VVNLRRVSSLNLVTLDFHMDMSAPRGERRESREMGRKGGERNGEAFGL